MSKINWIQTYTGKQFWPFDPKPEDICIIDIAWSLSNICRFQGHSKRLYSVAEHSIHVSNFCSNYPFEGLMHDAAEAYLSDVSRPIKPMLKGFKEIEDRILEVIFKKYNLIWPIPDEVEYADKTILIDEQIELMPNPPADWNHVSAKPLGIKWEENYMGYCGIYTYIGPFIYKRFMWKFNELIKRCNTCNGSGQIPCPDGFAIC